MHDAYDDTTSLLDNTVPLGEFLDEQLARVRENEITKTNDINESDDEVAQDQHRLDDIVLLEENRLRAPTCVARYQQALRQYHSCRVRAWCFKEGD